MELRPYQSEAVEAVYHHLRTREDNPCVVIPTAGGKTPVMATICRDAVSLWNGRVLILAHVKELLEQALDKLRTIAPDLPVGLYSASLKRRELNCAVTIAGIQSIYQRACDLGPVNLIIVDEAHMIPAEGDGMYRTFIADARVVNPEVRVIGLTATPFRLKTGMISGPDNILNHICYEVGVRELIVQGYLCPLRTKAGVARADMSGLHTRAGEFIAGEVEDVMDTDDLVQGACAEIIEQTADRRSVLIFTSGIRHGQHVAETLRSRHGVECGFVEGNTPIRERDALLERFKAGELKYLANVNVLTTGFDAPGIDCVAMLRPTLSPGLYYQMVGRGFRLHPEKSDCLVLDFGGNIMRHGPIDDLLIEEPIERVGKAPMKECPGCHAVISAGYLTCPECGYEFPPPQRSKHEPQATNAGILSDQVSQTEHTVDGVSYHVHYKRNDPSAAPTMRVEYRCGFSTTFREWVCFEHTGYARQKAEQWWRRRSNEPVPDSVDEAVDLADCGALAPTISITVERKAGEKYDRIVNHVLGPKPLNIENEQGAAAVASAYGGIPEDEIPF